MPYPTTPKFTAAGVESYDPTLVSEAISGRIQSRKVGSQQWKFTASYAPLTRSEFAPVWAFLASQRGRHGIFTIILPELSASSGNPSGTVTTSAALVGTSAVTVASLTGTLKAGDFFKFSGHDKVYMLTADRAGAGSISFIPELVSAVGSEQLIYNDVPFTVRMANDVQSYKVGKEMLFSNEVDLVEAI